MAQSYTVFNNGSKRPQEDINYQYRTVVLLSGVNLAPKVFLTGNSKDKFGKKTPQDALIMDNLETKFYTTVDKTRVHVGRSIV